MANRYHWHLLLYLKIRYYSPRKGLRDDEIQVMQGDNLFIQIKYSWFESSDAWMKGLAILSTRGIHDTLSHLWNG